MSMLRELRAVGMAALRDRIGVAPAAPCARRSRLRAHRQPELNSLTVDPTAVSAELTRQALRAAAASGAPRVHLIGHSLGGLIVRSALAASPGLGFRTGGVVTIASPHGGISLARVAPGQCARIMHPGHRCTQPEAGAPGPVRWLAY